MSSKCNICDKDIFKRREKGRLFKQVCDYKEDDFQNVTCVNWIEYEVRKHA